MKIKRILFALFAAVMLVTVSCKKYEDGPTFSLASKKGRVAGTWTVESASYTESGTTVDITASVKADLTSMELTKDGDGKFVFDGGEDEFQWEFDDKKEKLVFVYDVDDREEWEIRRLKKKELWIRLPDPDGSYIEIHFEQ